MAERVGFEPTRACTLHAFQACLFGRSSTSPREIHLRAGYDTGASPHRGTFVVVAERVVFEPTRACTLPLFENGTFGHSDTSPRV